MGRGGRNGGAATRAGAGECGVCGDGAAGAVVAVEASHVEGYLNVWCIRRLTNNWPSFPLAHVHRRGQGDPGRIRQFTRRLRLRCVRISVQGDALRGRTALIHDAVRPRKDCFGGSLSSPRTTWVGLNKLPTIAEEPRSMKQSTARPPNPRSSGQIPADFPDQRSRRGVCPCWKRRRKE